MKKLRFKQARAADTYAVAVRLGALDVGFDVRELGYVVDVPGDCDRASYDDVDGERWYVEGTRADVVRELEAAGYAVCKVQP